MESVILQGSANGALVGAAARVADSHDVRVALIGGLAVVARLGRVHRATNDVDTVSETPSSGSTASLVVAQGIANPDPSGGTVSRVYVDGVKVEIIETEPLPADLTGVPIKDVLFVTSHRYALESATLLQVDVAGTDVSAALPVATPAALVGTKLHALADRHDENKKASDTHDLFGLVQRHDPSIIADELATQAPQLANAVLEVGEPVLITNAERVARYLKVSGADEVAALSADDLRAVFRPLFVELRVRL